MQTIKLYDQDAYLREFEAQITACEQTENGYRLQLDRTAFFPEEGGQTADWGYIVIEGSKMKIPIADVQIQKEEATGEEQIIHLIAEVPETVKLANGMNIKGEIDWAHRFSNMQQHTGEHIFSGIMNRDYGFENVGFHLSDQIVTMDFDGILTQEQLERAEDEVNAAIAANVPVTAYYPTPEELRNLSYRSKKEIDGDIRIVTVEGYDICACCAPHVSRTGEIGGFKIMNMQSHRGGMRISFLCGKRALYAFREQMNILNELVELMSTNAHQIADNITKLKNELSATKGQLGDANRKLLLQQIEEVPDGQTNVILFTEGIEGKALRDTVNLMMERHDGVAALFSQSGDGYRFIIGSKTVDCREVAKQMKEQIGAQGGGSPQMVQGSVQAKEAQIRDLLEHFGEKQESE